MMEIIYFKKLFGDNIMIKNKREYKLFTQKLE
jgi:hypothetical protein